MKNLHDWTATRSGPAMTILGADDAGAMVKITGVVTITADLLWPVAHGEDGERYRLLPKNHDQIRAAIAATVGSPSELMGFMGEDDAERCIACNVAFVDDDLVHTDEGGGFIHASCCGPERESYVKAGGEPLGPEDPIPTPFRWGDLPQPAAAAEA